MNQFPNKNYFTMLNEIFSLGLDASEIAVYAYLRCLESRSTYQCWPSYTTIGNAVGRAKNTVMRYVDVLAEKGLIYGIAGHNYMKLRDIGKAVGFNVFWDADSGCVQIETGAPYTGEAPSAEAVPPAAAPSDVDAAKQDIVARTNALRAERGIAALTADDQLMRAAQVRADEMAATGNYSHTRPDGRKYYTVTDCRQVGENIHQIPLLYLAQQKTALAETLIYSWSKSAGHMENMTDESYAAIGVGLARGTDANGLECWYCVQLFLRSGYSISAVDKPATK